MVALIVNVDGAPIGIHRTYLALDGKAKAPVAPAKMTLGSCRHGAVRLDAIKHSKRSSVGRAAVWHRSTRATPIVSG
jgi:hypothetical protein